MQGWASPKYPVRAWLLAAVLLCLIVLFVLPLMVNSYLNTDAFLQQIEARIGKTIRIDSIELRWFPRISLELLETRVIDPASAEPIFSAPRVDFAVRAWPLLRGQIVGDHIIVERPEITLHRSPSGTWTLLPSDDDTNQSSSTTVEPFSLLPLFHRVLVTEGRIRVIDHGATGAHAAYLITPVQILASEGMAPRTITVEVSGQLPHDSDVGFFKLAGTLTQLRGESEAAESEPATPRVQFEGRFLAHRMNLQQLVNWSPLGPISDGLHGSAQLTARVLLVPRTRGYDLIASEWNAKLGDLSASGAGSLTGLGTDQTFLSATLSTAPLGVHRWLEQLPSEWKPSQVQTWIHEHAVDGILAVHSAKLTGTLHPTARMTITGAIEVRDGRFRAGEEHPPVKQLSAMIRCDPVQIRITDLRAEYGPVLLSEGTILVTDWTATPTVDIRLTGHSPASDVIALLSNTYKSAQADMLLTRFGPVSGDVKTTAHFAGKPTKTGRVDLVDADVTFRNVGIRTPILQVPIHRVHGHLKVSPLAIHLDQLHGQLGPAQIDAQGVLSLSGSPSYDALSLRVSANAADLLPLLPWLGRPNVRTHADGPIRAVATLSGPLGTPRIEGAIQLQSMILDVPTIFTKSAGDPGAIEFDVTLTDDLVLSVREFAVLLPPLRLNGGGRFQLTKSMTFAAHLALDQISLESLPQGTALGSLRAGLCQAVFDVRGQAHDPATWRTFGRIQLDKGRIALDTLEQPPIGLALILRFADRTVDIERLALEIGTSDIRVSGSVTDWTSAPRGKLVVQSSQLDLGLFRSLDTHSSAESDSPSVLNTWLASGRLNATVIIDHVYYKRLLITGLSSNVKIDQGVLTLDRISGDTNDGHVGGRLLVRPTDRSEGQMQSAFRISGLPFERILDLAGRDHAMEGWLSANGKFQLELDQKGPLVASVVTRRPIRILIEDGRIFNIPVITKLLSAMNLPALLRGEVDLNKDGLPLDRLKGILSINHGIVTIRELILDSPVLKIIGTGRYDYVADEFDMVLATSPLGSYSDLLKRIPLFGRIFAGERQGFDTAVFQVRGSAQDPDLEYLPTDTLLGGLKGTAQLAFDILANTITLGKDAIWNPQDFLDGEEGSSGPTDATASDEY